MAIFFSDLKLENCLLGAEGHVRLTDFGTAKELGEGGVTSTFCGMLSTNTEVFKCELKKA